MEILNIFLVLLTIAGVIRLKKPLFMAIGAAIIATVLLFDINLMDFLQVVLKSLTDKNTLITLLVFYFITYLQRMLESRDCLSLAQQSFDNIFNNRRITMIFAPFFLGLLPSPSVASICGSLIDKSSGNYLNTEEKAFVASYYRHIPESFIPTFTSVIIGINLTNGIVTANSFILAMIPMLISMILIGYWFYLKKVPKHTISDFNTISKTKLEYTKALVQGFWPIALIILLIICFSTPVLIASFVVIIAFMIVGKFKPSELIIFSRTAFERNMLLSTIMIFIFKDTLNISGIMDILPESLAASGLPPIYMLSLLFFFGALISNIQTIAAIGLPLAFIMIPSMGLSEFTLLMSCGWIASQLAPTHICLIIIVEHFKISFGSLLKKTIPVMLCFTVTLFGYYYLLSAIGI